MSFGSLIWDEPPVPPPSGSTTSLVLTSSGEFTSQVYLPSESASLLRQFIAHPLPFTAIKEWAQLLAASQSSRRRRRRVEPKEEDSECALEVSSLRQLDSQVHLYVGRYLRYSMPPREKGEGKKHKSCGIGERLRCRREQQTRLTDTDGACCPGSCLSCSWDHGQQLVASYFVEQIAGSQYYAFVGGAKRLLYHASAFLANLVYVFGGISAGGKSASLWTLDVRDGAWQCVPAHRRLDSDPPVERNPLSDAVTLVTEQNRDLGESTDIALHWLMHTSLSDSASSVLTDAPELRFSHTLSAYNDKELILFGGDRGPGDLNDLWRFDVKTNSWSRDDYTSEEIPLARSGHAAVIWGPFLVIVGGAGGPEVYNDIWLYNLETKAWRSVPIGASPSPDPRAGHVCGISQDTLFLFGGVRFHTVFNDLWTFNLTQTLDPTRTSFSWKEVKASGPSPSPRSRHSAVMIDLDEWLIYGGKHGAFSYNGELFSLNTTTMTWTRRVIFRPGSRSRRQWWNGPEILRQLPQLHCHSMSYDHKRGIVVVTGGCDGDGSAKDSTLLLKRASTAAVVFDEWRRAGPERWPLRSLPRFLAEHYDPFATEMLKYL